jgi:hypothetical protein
MSCYSIITNRHSRVSDILSKAAEKMGILLGTPDDEVVEKFEQLCGFLVACVCRVCCLIKCADARVNSIAFLVDKIKLAKVNFRNAQCSEHTSATVPNPFEKSENARSALLGLVDAIITVATETNIMDATYST